MERETFWRLLDWEGATCPSGVQEAAWNMAVDEALLESVLANTTLPTLRLYQWDSPAAITLGRFQNVARTVNLAACKSGGFTVTRRITGGRGILHGDDLTLAIVAPMAAVGLEEGGGVRQVYMRLLPAFQRAFARMGLDTTGGSTEQNSAPRSSGTNGDCFATVSQSDVVEAGSGRKRMGAALHRRGSCFLEQASIPLQSRYSASWHLELAARLLNSRSSEPYEELPAEIDAPQLKKALIQELALLAECIWKVEPLTPGERTLALHLVETRFADPIWVQDGRQDSRSE